MTCVCTECLGFDPLDPTVLEGRPLDEQLRVIVEQDAEGQS